MSNNSRLIQPLGTPVNFQPGDNPLPPLTQHMAPINYENSTKILLPPHIVQGEPSEVPEFNCPITLGIMNMPVVASDGHSYDQIALDYILTNTKLPRSPINREIIKSEYYINWTLKKLIDDWGSKQWCKQSCKIQGDPSKFPSLFGATITSINQEPAKTPLEEAPPEEAPPKKSKLGKYLTRLRRRRIVPIGGTKKKKGSTKRITVGLKNKKRKKRLKRTRKLVVNKI
tara:strand:+ start:1755 stop:2438 length:684 start_codon:yes stop_codon:yes gene_type:complete